jgi:tetratricopeptide (TPR) repeat protein
MKAPVLLCLAFSLATALAEKRPAENPDNSDDAQASAAFLAGDYDTAISLYNEVIKAHPKEALAYNGRALVYRYKKDDAKALADFDQAIRLKPFWMFYYNRGVTRYENGDAKSAIADLTRALQNKPGGPRARADCLVARARCYINQAESAPAMSDLNAAIKLHEDSEAHRLRGIVHKVAHEYDKSLADYEKAIALDPKNADAYGTEAYLLSVCPAPKYRDGAKAVRYATKACELTEWRITQAIEALAAAYAETGDFDKAIQFQKQADEMDKQADPAPLALYEKHQPLRDLNRSEKTIPLPEAGKVAIKLGEKLTAHFEVDGENLGNPTTAKGEHVGENSFALDFHLHNGGRLLLLQHSFPKIIRVRCLARLKGQDAYFETDLLPVPPNATSREIWSEQIEELVLFDFHFEGRKSEKSVTERAMKQGMSYGSTTRTPSFAVRSAKSPLSRRVIGPTSPLPIVRPSSLITPANSPMVPVQNISSAPKT